MRRGMSAREWNRWKIYFARRWQEKELARMTVQEG